MKNRLAILCVMLCLLAALLTGIAVQTRAQTISWDGWTPIRREADLMAIDDTEGA